MAHLNQGAPFVLIHQPYQHRGELLDVGSKLAQDGETVGLLASYDNVHEQGVISDVGKAGALAPRLADAGYRFDRKTIGRVNAASWIARPEPTSVHAWDQTVDEAAAAQRSLGLDAITTPAPELLGAHGVNELRASLDAARRGFGKRPANDPPWFARLTVHDEWLVKSSSRTALLNELSNLPEDLGVALHVRWRKTNPETDADLLQGLKTFALALAGDDRALLVLRSGIVGWLSLAWNVNALSAGLSLASWADSWRGGGGAKPNQPKPPNIKWFFESMLLRRFRKDEHDSLALQSNYLACACLYCSALQAGATWSPTAGQHALYALAELTNQIAAVPAGQRRQKVIDIVQKAEADWKQIVPPGLSSGQKPAHLQTWLQVL
jgi:hypothetical protein